MWKCLSYILISAIFLTTVFGFAYMGMGSMSSGMHNMSVDCFASIFAGFGCLQSGIASVIHHISAYQTFIAGLLVNSLSVDLLLLAFFIVALYFVFKTFSLNDQSVFSFARTEEPNLTFKESTHSWLSLFENSPSF